MKFSVFATPFIIALALISPAMGCSSSPSVNRQIMDLLNRIFRPVFKMILRRAPSSEHHFENFSKPPYSNLYPTWNSTNNHHHHYHYNNYPCSICLWNWKRTTPCFQPTRKTRPSLHVLCLRWCLQTRPISSWWSQLLLWPRRKQNRRINCFWWCPIWTIQRVLGHAIIIHFQFELDFMIRASWTLRWDFKIIPWSRPLIGWRIGYHLKILVRFNIQILRF